MKPVLVIRNCQRGVPVDVAGLRRLARRLLAALGRGHSADLGIYLVDTAEITRLNETFLRHHGPTDVITFDYAENPSVLHGEIFICLAEAQAQARRFRTTWTRELARYLVHGALHLEGYDDRAATDRRKMKREENRLLRELGRAFKPADLASRPIPRRRASTANRKS